jgi:uncharacterized membrane protein
MKIHHVKHRNPTLVDKVASFIGSWRFIIMQTSIIIIWITFNLLGWFSFDSFPFVFLNLALSFQAAFTAPIIMMSQNRDAINDRNNNEADYEVDMLVADKIESIIHKITNIEAKLNQILEKK